MVVLYVVIVVGCVDQAWFAKQPRLFRLASPAVVTIRLSSLGFARADAVKTMDRQSRPWPRQYGRVSVRTT